MTCSSIPDSAVLVLIAFWRIRVCRDVAQPPGSLEGHERSCVRLVSSASTGNRIGAGACGSDFRATLAATSHAHANPRTAGPAIRVSPASAPSTSAANTASTFAILPVASAPLLDVPSSRSSRVHAAECPPTAYRVDQTLVGLGVAVESCR